MTVRRVPAGNFLLAAGIALVALRTFLVVVHPMKSPLHTSTGPPSGVLPRFAQVTRLMMGMAGILMALLFLSPGGLRGQTSGGSYTVNLAWDASTSTDVTGYLIHIGTASGTYTASIVVGNVTSGTVSGLAEGVTYHFTVTAFNAEGLESGFSNEVNFKTGLHTSRIRIAEDGKPVLHVRGLVGRQYDIEASVDLDAWTLIETATVPEGGSLVFSDPAAGNYPQRFYRTRPRP